MIFHTSALQHLLLNAFSVNLEYFVQHIYCHFPDKIVDSPSFEGIFRELKAHNLLLNDRNNNGSKVVVNLQKYPIFMSIFKRFSVKFQVFQGLVAI